MISDSIQTNNEGWLIDNIDITINECSGAVHEYNNNLGYSNVFPNPLTSISTLEFLNENHDHTYIRISNTKGRVVGVLHTKESCIQIERSFFPDPGVYFYQIVQKGATIATGKILCN